LTPGYPYNRQGEDPRLVSRNTIVFCPLASDTPTGSIARFRSPDLHAPGVDAEVLDDELVADDDDSGAVVAAEEVGVELVGAVELHAPDPNTAANKAIRAHIVITLI